MNQYAPSPPRSLTAELGREVEKYDKICDVMEYHLLRAIATIQREIDRENDRIAEAANATASVARRTRSHSMSPATRRTSLPPTTVPEVEMADGSMSNTQPKQSSPAPSGSFSGFGNPLRRQSTISLSSLHRPQFPHKLDLSAAGLRMTAEDISLFSAVSAGRASPVTLAPRSARMMPDGSFPDLMASLASTGGSHAVDIDLTVPDNGAQSALMVDIGSSADKPIELDLDAMDLDMTELFGDPGVTSSSGEAGPALFTPQMERPVKVEENDFESQILGAFSGVRQSSSDPDSLFGPSRGDSESGSMALPVPGPSQSVNAPSPNSMLANFQSDSIIAQDSASGPFNLVKPSGDAPFDLSGIDLNNLSFMPTGDDASNLKEMEEMLKNSGF